MAPLVGGSGLAFAMVKIGLTAGGVMLLTQLARMRAFGRVPVGSAACTAVLARYCVADSPTSSRLLNATA